MESLLILTTERKGVSAPPRLAFASRALMTLVATACSGLQPLHASTFSETQEALNNELVMASVSEPLVDRHDFINAQKSQHASDGMIELEKLFLMCDHTAAVGMLDAHETELCPVVSEQLRLAKFDGDLDRLLAWSYRQREAELHTLGRVDFIGQCSQGDKP